HSLHHSQRRVTAWTDDRNHILDELLVNLVLAVFAQFVGVQPDDFVLILIVGRLVESFSHVGLDLGFGWLGARLLVAPRFHRLHHALADARDRTSTTTTSPRCFRSGTCCSAPHASTCRRVRPASTTARS